MTGSTAAERLALLGPDMIAALRAEGAAAPLPGPRTLAELPILLRRWPSADDDTDTPPTPRRTHAA